MVAREKADLLQQENGDLVTMDTGKAEVLNDHFTSVFNGKGSMHCLSLRKHRWRMGKG